MVLKAGGLFGELRGVQRRGPMQADMPPCCYACKYFSLYSRRTGRKRLESQTIERREPPRR